MHILSVKKICLCYVYYQTIEIIFKINIVICYSWLFPVPYFLLIFLASFWKAKTGLRMSLRNRKMINYHIKGLNKTTCYQTNSNFSQFFFPHWLLHKCFLSFLIKAFANFEKLIRFHWQAFIVYKNGENLKMLIEIFYQKLIVSNLILAFLDHLKPKIFFFGRHRAPPLFEIFGSAFAISSFSSFWGFTDSILFDHPLIDNYLSCQTSHIDWYLQKSLFGNGLCLNLTSLSLVCQARP